MGWLEQTIRRYEHRRWATDNNRRPLPFEWGLQHLGGRADEPNPRAWLDQFVTETVAHSDDWFDVAPADDYQLRDGLLTFTSAVRSPWPENNAVYARFFPARTSGPAVVVLPNWKGKMNSHVDICRWLNWLGITTLRLSLPYHDWRAIPGQERADFLVAPNIGLTMQANRQAVMDLRRCLRWLEQQGYTKLGVLGSSIGSAIAFIAMAHDRAIRAGVFLHVSTYFGDVVSTGLTTTHVWESLRAKVTADELRHFWKPISPFPYVPRVAGTGQCCLMVSGRYDPVFWPEFSDHLLETLRQLGVRHETLRLPCGHYSLGEAPFKWIAGGRFGTFLFEALA